MQTSISVNSNELQSRVAAGGVKNSQVKSPVYTGQFSYSWHL